MTVFASTLISNKHALEHTFRILSKAHAPIKTYERDIQHTFQTNHFVGEQTQMLDKEPARDNTLKRFDRLEELLSGQDALTIPILKSILQDRMDPWSREETSIGTFNDGNSLATNGALFGVIFVPELQHFYSIFGQR